MTTAGVSGSSRAIAASTGPAILLQNAPWMPPGAADGSALSTRENYNDLMPEARTPQTVDPHDHAHPGDGIGPEVTEAVLRILAASGVSIEWDRHLAGVLAFERTGKALPGRAASSRSSEPRSRSRAR